MRTVWKCLDAFEEATIALLLAISSTVLFVDVAARFLTNTSFVWAAEFVRYAIIWMVFLGSSVAARKGIHISIDVLLEILPRPIGIAVSAVVLLLSIGFSVILCVYGAQLVSQMRLFGQTSPAMQISMFLVYAAIPLGGALMAIRFSQRLWAVLRTGKWQTVANAASEETYGEVGR